MKKNLVSTITLSKSQNAKILMGMLKIPKRKNNAKKSDIRRVVEFIKDSPSGRYSLNAITDNKT
jgi:hypothetical protein